MTTKNIIQPFTIFLIGLKLVCISLPAQIKPDDIAGIWLTGGKEPAKIQVYKSSDKYFGKIVWLKNPTENGKPKVDTNNPNKTKRNNQIIGLGILKGFQFDGDDEWDDGEIYDPETGKTYSCYISLKDKNTLKVRGYVGISLFGRTEIWTKTIL
jgi:uncharacterized protein (DUF2147 family)